MLFFLVEFSPPLLLVYETFASEDQFWSRLECAVASLTSDVNVPSTIRRFPDFVVFLHKHQLDLHFDEPRKVLKLLDVKPSIFDEKFILWKLPQTLSNPLLYLESFLAMKDANHLLFQNFIAIPGAVDLFMDRYIPLLGPTSPIPLIEITLSMFIEKVGKLTNPVDVAAAIWLGLSDVIRSPDLTTAAEGFRGAMIVFSLSRCLFPGEHHVEWLFDLLEIVSDRTELYSICVYFCGACDLAGFKPGRLCQGMIRHDSPDGTDIRLLSWIGIRTELRNPLFAIKYMFERGTSDSLLTQTAAVSVVPLLQRHFEPSLYVQDWVSRFVRVAFEFVAVSQRKMKYRNRRLTVLLFFEAVVKFGFRPINEIIIKLWSTLIVGGLAPNWPIEIPGDKDCGFHAEVARGFAPGFDLKHAMENVALPEKPARKGPRNPQKLIAHRLPVIASPLRDVSPTRKMANGTPIRLSQSRRQGIRPSFCRK
jgi:hypothetical protein